MNRHTGMKALGVPLLQVSFDIRGHYNWGFVEDHEGEGIRGQPIIVCVPPYGDSVVASAGSMSW